MLLTLYITILVLAFLFFGIAIYLGSKQNNMGMEMSIKTGVIFLFLLMGVIMFIIAGLQSLNIQTEHCENTIVNATTTGNITIYSNNIECQNVRYSSEALGGFCGFMVIISILLLLYYTFSKE